MLNLKTLAVCSALAAGGLVGVGCHDNAPRAGGEAAAMPDTAGMSKDDLIAKGDLMIQKGTRLKERAAGLKPGESSNGLSADDLMTQGDEMIKNGKQMRDAGTSM